MPPAPALRTAHEFLSSTLHSHSIAQYPTLVSTFSTHSDMNWPEEMCRARRVRIDGFRQVVDVEE